MYNVIYMLLGTFFLALAYQALPLVITKTIIGLICAVIGLYLFLHGLFYKNDNLKSK